MEGPGDFCETVHKFAVVAGQAEEGSKLSCGLGGHSPPQSCLGRSQSLLRTPHAPGSALLVPRIDTSHDLTSVLCPSDVWRLFPGTSGVLRSRWSILKRRPSLSAVTGGPSRSWRTASAAGRLQERRTAQRA